ncbi:uncharacterized protein Hap1MRO34_005592 [Clarias gariepinus]
MSATMKMMIARALFTAVIYSHVVSASVVETTENYSCQEGPQVLTSELARGAIDCEQSWSAESTPIGSFMSGSVECHSPCTNVTAGQIIISICVNLSLTVICFQEHVTEYRTHFLGLQMTPLPLQNFKKRDRYGIYACLILLVLVLTGFATLHIFAPQNWKHRSTRV